MFNSRNIPNELWAQARQVLIFYFTRRFGIQNAEDLAQDTLLAIWTREDYEFAEREDFLKVCFGFARNILKEGYRENLKVSGEIEIDPEFEEVVPYVKGLKGPEVSAFLEQVKRCAEEELAPKDQQLLDNAIKGNEDDGPNPGNIRVRLHRIRKKLGEKTGWTKKKYPGKKS
jgi:DNA-directed RNA polymerase specialized sigma24 family protein